MLTHISNRKMRISKMPILSNLHVDIYLIYQHSLYLSDHKDQSQTLQVDFDTCNILKYSIYLYVLFENKLI
jgi:hypothetical protein